METFFTVLIVAVVLTELVLYFSVGYEEHSSFPNWSDIPERVHRWIKLTTWGVPLLCSAWGYYLGMVSGEVAIGIALIVPIVNLLSLLYTEWCMHKLRQAHDAALSAPLPPPEPPSTEQKIEELLKQNKH